MTNEHVIGIDIGTQSMKLVIAESDTQHTHIIHAIESPAHGFRHGYITDIEKAAASLNKLLIKATKEYKQKITKARFAIGGVGLQSQYVRTSIENTRKSNDITERNVEEVIQKSEDLFTRKYPNKKILHIIPVKYRVDDKDVLGTPIGMYGSSLEVKVIFITILEHHYDALVAIIEKNNIEILDIIASPIADGTGSINYKKRTQGCMLANIGAETTSIATFENGIITSLDVLPIGANDITNDIALGLQIPLEVAEKITIGKNTDHPKRKVDEIIQARIADILELSTKHLQKIKKNRLLPAGIIFTGGASHLEHLNDYAKQELKIPAESLGLFKTSKKSKRLLALSNKFSTAYGLCISESNRYTPSSNFSLKKIKQSFNYWLNQIMP